MASMMVPVVTKPPSKSNAAMLTTLQATAAPVSLLDAVIKRPDGKAVVEAERRQPVTEHFKPNTAPLSVIVPPSTQTPKQPAIDAFQTPNIPKDSMLKASPTAVTTVPTTREPSDSPAAANLVETTVQTSTMNASKLGSKIISTIPPKRNDDSTMAQLACNDEEEVLAPKLPEKQLH